MLANVKKHEHQLISKASTPGDFDLTYNNVSAPSQTGRLVFLAIYSRGGKYKSQ